MTPVIIQRKCDKTGRP